MKNVICFICFVAFTCGCEKAEIPTYEGREYVQFYDNENENYGKLEKIFSFRYSGTGVYIDTVFLDVIISGPRADYDRKVVLKQVKEYNFEFEYDEEGVRTDSALIEVGNQAIPNVHYVPFDDPGAEKLLYVKKGEVKGKIGILLRRDVSLMSENFNLNVEIVPGDDFLVGDIRATKAVVTISDQLTRPEGWNDVSGPNTKPNQSLYWGVYGPVKHQFMIDHSPAGERWDSDFLKELNLDKGKMLWYASLFTRELNMVNQERADQGMGPLMEDPDDPNTVIEFPK